MMSLFKRETKEDKERKKLEKKALKESKLQQQQQQLNNVNLSNITNKTNSLDSTDMDISIHSGNNNNNNNNSDINTSTTTIANLITKFETTPKSIDQQQQQQNVNVPPRPKKGILKGMSKFTHSLSSSSSTSSSSPSINQQQQQQTSQLLIESSSPSSLSSSSLVNKSITKIQAPTIIQPQQSQPQQQQNLNIDINNLNLPDIKKTKDEHSIREIIIISNNLDKLNIYEKNLQYFIEYKQQQQQQLNDCILLPGDLLIQINNLNCKELTLQQIKQQIITHQHNNKPLQLKVKTSPESLEFIMRNTLDGLKIPDSYLNNGTLKRVGSLRHKSVGGTIPLLKQSSNSIDQQQQQQSVTSTSSLSSLTSSTSSSSFNYNDDCVWLMHTNGYSSAKIINKINDTINGTNEIKYKIKLDNGNIIEVNEENIEKANPSKFDRIEDLSNLRFINETSIIHTIRQRYGSSLIHTYAGINLCIVKPTSSLSIYNDKVISMFKGCKQEDMPPHIYSYTQSIYRNMLSTRLDHSIILMGHSGSGKTANSKHILDYLSKAAPNNKELINETKINAMFCLLEAFCCIQTIRNEIANRFINVFLLEFGNTGQIISLLLQLIVLDHTRLVFQSENETNYLIFYYLLYGSESNLLTDLQINNNLDDANLFIKPTFKSTTTLAASNWQRILNAFKILNFNDNEIKSILSILAAIYHLGNAGAVKVPQNPYNRGQFQQQNEAYKAANLLGISYEHLSESVFTLKNSANKYPSAARAAAVAVASSSHASPDQYAAYQHNLSPIECLYGFVIGLYQECLNLLTNCINRSFKLHNQSSICSLLVVDPPGFQATTNANYSDLISNYVSERLQLLFYQLNFINPIEVYTQEGLDIDLVEHIPESPSALVNWLDKPPHMIRNAGIINNSSNSSLTNLDTQSTGLGLLWLLEEELLADSKSINNFMRKLTESDRKQNFLSLNEKQDTSSNTDVSNFTIYHQFGQYPVEYNANRWLQTCKDYPTIRNAIVTLQESKRDSINESFVNPQFNSYNDIGSGSSLKRQASVRKMLTMSKKKTFTINLKLQLDSLFDSLRRTKSNFVFCLLPHSTLNKNLNSPTTTSNSLLNSSNASLNESNQLITNTLDVPLLRNQLKAYQILAACRLYRQGFPDSLNYDEFKRRYSMLTNLHAFIDSDYLADPKQASSQIIKTFDFELTQFKFGLNKLFFKAGILNKLEDQREEKINDLIKRLQCHARTYLARKNYERKKLEIAAIKCIQNNIRKYFILRKWTWWKLYTNLMPLVNVQNNETLVKQYKEELDDIKRKYDRLINEKNDLRLINNQLETKLMNLQTEYVEEHAANAGTIDLLEVETSERMRLERELNELRQLYNETLKKTEIVESELLEYRLNVTNNVATVAQRDDIDGLSNNHHINNTQANIVMNSGNNNSDDIYQYEKIKRDYDYLKQQYKQDKENLIEQNEQVKINYDNKLKELAQLNDNYENQLNIYKRKYQKLQEEIEDIQRLNDELKSRNKELERTQSKFDSDMHDLKQELQNEINLREKYQREKDQLQYEIYSLKADLENIKLDFDYQKEKNLRLEKDLKEYEATVTGSNTMMGNNSISGNGDNTSLQQQVIKLKSQVREMEVKIRDQEEELDDQAATIQQLEQFKLKLEMQLEKEKQKLQREIAEKESEMDDLRFHTQKKIKSIEIQLEEESEINSSLQREKRELERKLREHENNHGNNRGMNANDYDYVSKLKRQLQKYKALALDSQKQLEKLKDINAPKQASIMKALKLQLEDSEINKLNALKSKQMMQNEINELQSQLDDLIASKQHVEEQNIRFQHEINDLKTQVDEQERECEEILKKYQNHLQNNSLDSNRFIDLNNQIDLLTIENRILKDKLRELEEKANYYETTWIDKTVLNKYESKIRDLECKLDLELTYKNRLQNQLERLKQQNDKCLIDCEHLTNREKRTEDNLKRLNRANKDTQEEMTELRKKLTEYEETKKRLEDENDILDKELHNTQNELKLALNRIENFKNALNAMNDSSDMEFDSDIDLGLNSDSDDNDDMIGNEHLINLDNKNYLLNKTNNSSNGDDITNSNNKYLNVTNEHNSSYC